jgi:uncharacterized protein YecE (DUF72 family)
VPEHFRFVVKAPALVTDTVVRGGHGEADAPNPRFLDAELASDQFVNPAIAGLGAKAGPLVFQLAPLPRPLLRSADELHAIVERIGAFIAALPKDINGVTPVYSIEPRNGELLTPRLVRTLREVGARLCVSIHARMPEDRWSCAGTSTPASGTTRRRPATRRSTGCSTPTSSRAARLRT